MGTEPSAPPRGWSGAIGLGVVFGGLIALASTVAIGNAWAACGVGNGPGDGMTLLLLGPLIRVAAAVPWALLRGMPGRRHRGAALVVGLVFTLWLTWFLVTWLGMPDSYPAPSCPGNVPPWWPDFIPA
ncbi:hypothetical protein SAMN05216483_5677 [Streptomyces sp. 2131.1]|uniref:hypothetical protein n=1 Tax=Streptomyces sp. 2131.1 TaxID=1855346 RepID=UPI000898B6EE|nr:hypothetical protein [Streptomyces sp. 2131.1]SEE22910.1 hypothetical protein SAMN05216483_5677 [Streptomyces sp. 2131.1]